MTQRYVAGFAFDETFKNVLMIRKTKPEWQAGLLNGVGGKIESYDHDEWAAMAREFWEETGLNVGPLDWVRFDVERFPHGEINWFFARGVNISDATMTTEEKPLVVPVRELISYERTDAIYNIHYLLSKAMTFAVEPKREIPQM